MIEGRAVRGAACGNDRIREILREVRVLAAEYAAIAGKPLGVTGEIAEHAVAEALGLELAEARAAGYDAIRHLRDGGKQRVQIKGRVCSEKFNPGAKLGRLSRSGECDVVMLALLDDATLELREVWEAPHAAVVAALDVPGSKARNDRRQLSIGSFKKIAQRVWSAHD